MDDGEVQELKMDDGEVQELKMDDGEVQEVDDEVEQLERVEKLVEVNVTCDDLDGGDDEVQKLNDIEEITVEETRIEEVMEEAEKRDLEDDAEMEEDGITTELIEVDDEDEIKEVKRIDGDAKQATTTTSKPRQSLQLPDKQFELLEEWVKNSEKAFQCQKCDEAFKKHQDLILHKLEVHYHSDPVSPPFKCKICKKEFERENSVRKHEEQKHKKKHEEQKHKKGRSQSPTKVPTPFKCDVCDKLFENKNSVDDHKAQIHKTPQTKREITTQFSCKVCGKEFERENSVKKHEAQKHKPSQKGAADKPEEKPIQLKRFKCNICRKTFEKRLSVRKHEAQKHKPSQKGATDKQEEKPIEIKRFKCNICRKKFEKQTSVKKHEEQKHKTSASSAQTADPKSVHSSEVGFEHRQRILKECPYFRERNKDVNINDIRLLNPKQELKDLNCLPPGWKVQEKLLSSGRKIVTFVKLDLGLVFRSRVGVFEYVKFYGAHSREELEKMAKKLGITSSTK